MNSISLGFYIHARQRIIHQFPTAIIFRQVLLDLICAPNNFHAPTIFLFVTTFPLLQGCFVNSCIYPVVVPGSDDSDGRPRGIKRPAKSDGRRWPSNRWTGEQARNCRRPKVNIGITVKKVPLEGQACKFLVQVASANSPSRAIRPSYFALHGINASLIAIATSTLPQMNLMSNGKVFRSPLSENGLEVPLPVCRWI